jgi:tetratricopeptide (TPR) repeat protein
VIAALLAVAVTVSDPTGSDTVRFSNIRFDTAQNWSVVQSAPQMILRSTNDGMKSAMKITIEPAKPFPGTLEQALDAAWSAARGGRTPKEEPTREEPREIEVGGFVATIYAPLAPSGGVLVAVVKSGAKVTTLTFSADTDLAYGLGLMLSSPVVLSLEVVAEGGVAVTGGGPGSAGPDPGDAFDWNGPDVFEYGIYDHGCLRPEDEFGELRRTADGFVGSVPSRPVTYAAAMETLRKLLRNGAARAQYDAAGSFASKEHPRLFTAGAAARVMQGDPAGALAHLLAGIDAAPDDPDVLFNLASVLGEIGLPNESLAILGKLRETGRSPAMAMGLKADAAEAYLEGYDEMLRGNLAVAKAKLQTTISNQPFLNEARRVLSLIQAHEGGAAQGKKTYIDGMWRFNPGTPVLCGESLDKTRRPTVDKMFDTSRGKPGRLVDFRHPHAADDLPGFIEKVSALETRYASEAQAQGARLIRLGDVLHKSQGRDPTPYEAWADEMSSLIASLDEDEPLILKLQADRDASEKDAEAAVGRAASKVNMKLNELVLSGKKDLCPDQRSATTQAMSEIRPYLVHWETMQRRYAKSWYKMTTGLNAHIGDPKWHDFNDASLRADLAGYSVALLEDISSAYAHVNILTSNCLADAEQAYGTYLAPEEGPTCPDGGANLSFKYAFELPHPPGAHAGPKLGFQVDCEKFTVDIEYDFIGADGALAEFGLGTFGQVEMYRKGDWSLFAGAKVSGSVGGSGGSLKDGIWIKGSADGTISELGGKIAAETTMRTPEFSVSSPADEMVFNLLPEPPKPKRGPAIPAFRGAIP